MKQETRAGKYGRFLAVWINYTFEQQGRGYKSRFLEELKRYSFKPRREGEPRHEGCTLELEDLAEINIQTPEHLAKLIKEGIHLMYPKLCIPVLFWSMLKIISRSNFDISEKNCCQDIKCAVGEFTLISSLRFQEWI